MSEPEQDRDVHSRIDRIEVTLTHVTDALEKLAYVVNKPEKTQWGPILTAIGLLFVVGGGYTTLVSAPLQLAVIEQQREITDLTKLNMRQERALGHIEGRLEILSE